MVSGSNRFSPLTEIDNEMVEAGTTSRDTAGRGDVEVLPHDVFTPWASSVGPDGRTQQVSDVEGVGRVEVVPRRLVLDHPDTESVGFSERRSVGKSSRAHQVPQSMPSEVGWRCLGGDHLQ